MPHERPRYLLPTLLKGLKFSPLVGILGQRQAGKTTLMRSVVKTHYVSMDDRELLEAALLNPKSFISRENHPFGIDECQLAPPLFPALKLHVQNHPRPGQFILTGSIRFTSRKVIRESLTGRIFNLELLPFMLSEAHGLPLQNFHELVHSSADKLRNTIQARTRKLGPTEIGRYLESGGLPGISFHRDASIRKLKLAAHLDTLLERDLKFVLATTLSTMSVRSVLVYLAQAQGQPISISNLSRQTRVSMQTLNKLLMAFEALFLIRRIGSIGDRKKSIFYLEDQGMATFLAPQNSQEGDLLRLAFSQLHSQIRYLYPADGTVTHFEARGGARVPIVLNAGGKITGCIPIAVEAADRSALLSAKSFLARFPEARVAILTQGTEVVSLGRGISAVPLMGAL